MSDEKEMLARAARQSDLVRLMAPDVPKAKPDRTLPPMTFSMGSVNGTWTVVNSEGQEYMVNTSGPISIEGVIRPRTARTQGSVTVTLMNDDSVAAGDVVIARQEPPVPTSSVFTDGFIHHRSCIGVTALYEADAVTEDWNLVTCVYCREERQRPR